MVEERLENTLMNMGYQRINSNTPDIYLFYYTEGTELFVVSVIRAVTGNELLNEQYENILKQIRNNFLNSYPYRIRLLSLLLTAFPDRIKHLFAGNDRDNHWIIDLSMNRLMIYETQTNEFAGLRNKIEELLDEEQRQSGQDGELFSGGDFGGTGMPGNYKSMQVHARGKLNLFTPMNAILIIANVIAFFVLHYTLFFGGEEQMLSKGALSWYFVVEKKEYYRILTSMFMHSDWSHLFNNMLVLLFVGVNLERAAGRFKYLFIYFGAGIIAGITSISYNMWKAYGQISEPPVFSIGASGAIFGIVGAMLFIVIINRGRLENISTRQMVLFAIFSLYGGIANTQIDQAAHVGGFLAGILLAALLYRRPRKNITGDNR